jgi:phage terminase large subunit GpA-like protein
MGAVQPIQQMMTKTRYKCVEDITLALLGIIKPSERLTVSQTAAKYRKLNNKGSFVGAWQNATTPYMVEPMDTLDSREHDSETFVGPAQSGKTDGLLINWIAHSVKTDPMDIIIYSPTSAAARDFSLRRVDRLNSDSPEIGSMLSSNRDSDNRLDKQYVSGTLLTLSHPSKTELAGKPVPHVGLTDYDRFPLDIDGDGSAFALASKRTTSFNSFAMTVAESSPSQPIEDPKWIAKTAHEAPPTKGIFSLYNQGDRRRWYWPCPHCNRYFEGKWEHIGWDETKPTDIEKAESVYMACPVNGCVIEPSDRYEMNLWGRWLKDGEVFNSDGQVIGQGQRTLMASFWLRGVAAAFTTWSKLVSSYLAALGDYERTADEGALQKFFNTDLAEPYLPYSAENVRLPEYLKARAEPLGERVVPIGTRLLIACVDVQKNAYVVQMHGISAGAPCDISVIDRFTILKSQRVDDDGERVYVKPHAYLEDWDEIETQVMNKTYPLADGSGRRMMVKLTLCDSGGYTKKRGEGVTEKAYDFYRKLKREGKHGRFHLVKGDPRPGQRRAHISFPDAQKRDRLSAARGDVPILLLNSNVLKDALNSRLDCITPGKGMIRFPDWLEDWWFVEMCCEVRTEKGWENPGGRNEAWDLLYYCLGAIASKLLLLEQVDWTNPPKWAAEWDANDMISEADAPQKFAQKRNNDYDFSELAGNLA